MDSPLGSVRDHVFLCWHEKIWPENCPPEFKYVCRGYVGDAFWLFLSKDDI